MHVELVDFISIPTRDVARAAEWYRAVLGLSPSRYTPGEVETPNVTLAFWNPEEQGERFVPNENGIALRVPDVHAAAEEVRSAGGDVVGVEDSGVCNMGFVKTPTETS